MSHNKHTGLVKGTLAAATFGSALVLSANAFAMTELAAGYMQAAPAAAGAVERKPAGEKDGLSVAKTKDGIKVAKTEGKCGEGKCGGEKKAGAEGKCGEGKCGAGKKHAEGKCGGEKKAGAEGKCGEGKCGAGKKHAEGKCGGAA